MAAEVLSRPEQSERETSEVERPRAPAPRAAAAQAPQEAAQERQNIPDMPQLPQAPDPPGGGELTQPLFSGDHVLETVAKNSVYLRQGARGPSIRAIQKFLIAQGANVGRAGANGEFGPETFKALKAWQAMHGVPSTGVFGHLTLAAMESESAVDASAPEQAPAGGEAQAPSTPRAAPSNPQGADGQTQAQAAGGNAPKGGVPGSDNGGLPDDFQKMWDAHPHNGHDDDTDTASSDLLAKQGFDPDAYSNTCAIRLSIMFNELGGDLKITREKAKGAGLDPGRIPFSKKTGYFYILSAKEMWTYLTKYAGQPAAMWPEDRRYTSEEEFQTAFDDEIEPEVSGKRGIVAFDKIFGFSGTGHVDLFDGMQLSDSARWYPCQQLKVWYV